MSSPSGCGWMLSCLHSCGIVPTYSGGGQASLKGPPSECGVGQRNCSVQPEPFLPVPPRTANTTQRDHSATSARPASLGTPQRPLPLPAAPALALTSMLRAGQTQLGVGGGGGQIWWRVGGGPYSRLGAYSGQGGGLPGSNPPRC